MGKENCVSAEQVYQAELESAINPRRRFWQARARNRSHRTDAAVWPGHLPPDYPESDGTDLVGVALSGGGIRSAMFNLGLLQSFQKAGLMKHVDYLASVSGGGYTNGYYSTLGHFANPDAPSAPPSSTTDSNSQADQLNRLSARDAQFLLDGQYLNRPIEFMTSYVICTAVLLLTALSAAVVLACLVAIFFRMFDFPEVRVWLSLFNLNTDFRVGWFSCVVAAVLGVTTLAFWRLIRYLRQTPGRNTPGQWAVIVAVAFASGCAIMIGNGDFTVSSGEGLLPKKLDLPDWQIPIALAILLFFSSVFRVSSLLKSEKVNATVWQKVMLYVVLGCTTWGAFLCLLGLIGQEDVSGFIRHRSPSFHRHDVVEQPALAAALSNEAELGGFFARSQKAQGGALRAYIASVAEQRRLQEELMVQRDWHSWLQLQSGPTLTRWRDTLLSYLSSDKNNIIRVYVRGVDECLHLEQLVLADLESNINPSSSRKDMRKLSSSEAAFLERHKLTARLVELAAQRVKRYPANAGSDRDKMKEDPFQDVANWMDGPASLVAVNGDGKRYRDLTAFKKLFESCWSVDKRWSTEHLSDYQQWQLNRMLLEIAFPNAIKQRAMISTPVVIREDQRFRLFLLLNALLVALLGVFILDINAASAWFRFYRRRIGETFLTKADAGGLRALHDLSPQQHGYPYPLFVAAMILPQAPAYQGPSRNKSKRANPTKLDESFASDWYSFLLSPMFCGWLPSGMNQVAFETKSYLPTDQYMDGSLQVDEAIVLSGAAVTPFMAKNTSLQLLMHIFNVRLEQWLPNPRLSRQPQNRRFSLSQMAREFLRNTDWDVDSWHYGVVADGGFREFLGVEELITRRCKVIIVSDAGCNNGLYEFGVLADLIRKLRLDHCVEILDLDHDRPLDTRRLKRRVELDGRSSQHFVLGRIRYPEHMHPAPGEHSLGIDVPNRPYSEGLLVYVQMSLTGDEDIDIEQFRRTNPSFPDEPISNQFYTRDQVESFRQLGEHIGKLLCRDIDSFDCELTPSSTVAAQAVATNEENAAEIPPSTHPAAMHYALQADQRLRMTRIRKLEDGFRSSYRNECRQEAMNSTDDVGIGWIMKQELIRYSTLCQIHQYENSTEHQLRVRDYVWHALEMIDEAREQELRGQLRPADVFGMAIECNRRHAGFRPEWPTAFFQVGGRDLLIKAAEVAEQLCGNPQTEDAFQAWLADQSNPMPPILMSVSRLAVMLPRGVFRLRGNRTAAELIACILNYILPMWGKENVLRNWVSNAGAQRELRRAIATGMASEVAETLLRLAQHPAESSHAPAGDGMPTHGRRTRARTSHRPMGKPTESANRLSKSSP